MIRHSEHTTRMFIIPVAQSTFTCSNSTMETQEQWDQVKKSKTSGFLMFSGGIKRDLVARNGLSFIQFYNLLHDKSL